MVPLKYLSNFCKILDVSLINCEISLMSNWLKNYVLVAGIAADQQPKFSVADTKRYVCLIHKLKSGIKNSTELILNLPPNLIRTFNVMLYKNF